jgi:hypothetical protein
LPLGLSNPKGDDLPASHLAGPAVLGVTVTVAIGVARYGTRLDAGAAAGLLVAVGFGSPIGQPHWLTIVAGYLPAQPMIDAATRAPAAPRRPPGPPRPRPTGPDRLGRRRPGRLPGAPLGT